MSAPFPAGLDPVALAQAALDTTPRGPAGFGDRLVAAVSAHGPLCVGIDPHPALLAAWGLPDDAEGLRRFTEITVTALAGHVAVLKPQSAFYERHGWRGMAVLEEALVAITARGFGSTLSLLDIKRGDIGSTMDGYADAFLGPDAPFGADAVTLSPYLGFGALAPALDAAAAARRGVFVLARTSNPEGAEVQLAQHGGRSVAQAVVDAAAARNAGSAGAGSVGVVIGATMDLDVDLGALNGPVLAPGLGAQGAAPTDCARRFAGTAGVVLPVSARGVLQAGPDVEALRAAAVALNNALADA